MPGGQGTDTEEKIRSILEQAQAIQEEIVANRRTIHKNPELGLDLPKTVALVKEKLIEMGYTPIDCGKSGVVATIRCV